MPRLRLLPEVTAIYSDQKAAEVLEYLMRRGGAIAIDTETTGLDIMRSRVLCWSMATDTDRYFVPLEYLLFFDPLFRRKDITWYLANAKYDMHMMANMGVQLAGRVFDIVVMDAMDDDTRAHGLKQQAHLAYDVRWGDFKDLFLSPEYVAQAISIDKAAFAQFKAMSLGDKLMFVYAEKPSIVENYATCDAFFTYMRAEDLIQSLAAEQLATAMVPGLDTLYDYFEIIEAPFTRVLWKMERTGVPVDLERVRQIDGPMRDGIRAAELKIRELVSPTFNPASAHELAELLFGKKGYGLTPVSFTTSKKNPVASVAEKDLTILQGRAQNKQLYGLLEAVLHHRHLTKLHGTFVKGIHRFLGPDDRIHCTLNQTGARTGRLSASNPGMQTIPVRNDEFKIRSIFCAPKGKKLLDCDYPQIQPRLAAVFAGEEGMLEAIRNGWDIHSANAANMFKHRDPNATYERINGAKEAKDARQRALEDFEKQLLKYRDGAKTVGLGVLFGQGPLKMAHTLGIEIPDAKELITNFFRTYPKLKKLIDDTHWECHETESAYTMLGRIRRLHKINNEFSRGIAQSEERAGFNHKIQGSEIEILKCAMLQIDASKEWHDLGGELALPVHDELLSFAPERNAKEALRVKTAIMGNPLAWGVIQLKLPVSVDPDGGYGDNWAEVH